MNPLDHVSLIDSNVTRCGEKSLLQRATGRFYTHALIGRPLARAVAAHLRALDASDLHVIDPCESGEWKIVHRHADPISTEDESGPLRTS